MTASLSPVYPSGFSTRGAPMADAEVVERMRNPHFRIGWLESELDMALAELRAVLANIRKSGGARITVELRIESIERTLRLCREALEPAADASEKVLPVAAATVTT